jgi:uncharacterized protein YecE (DUF72 family)
MATIRTGIGGWVFPPWRGTFYPKEVKQADELAYASRHVTAIEINGTFYRLQTPKTFRHWHDHTPDGFVFSMKGSRFITNRRVLAEAGEAIDKFLDSGMTELGPKFGPILWQLAPTKQFDEADIAAFLKFLPKRHRHAVEPRHPSFADKAFFALLRDHNVAVSFGDDPDYPAFDEVTADFVYARLRNSKESEKTGYPPEALDDIAKRFKAHTAEGRDAFVYFINGAKIRAPHAAQALIAKLDG